jgi:uncharacterized protein (TIGR01777 family)
MTILIAGGTGLIGSRLTEMLIANGHTVHILSRQTIRNKEKVKFFKWNIGVDIEEGAFFIEGSEKPVDGIINLTGAGIADKRWTAKRKEEIIASRVEPAAFIESTLNRLQIKVPVYVSASGVNYYNNSSEKKYVESDPVGTEFVQHVCDLWEEQANQLKSVANRVVCMRTGVVLAKKGSFLQKFTATTHLFVAGVFGSGQQYLSWIHIDDLCAFYMHALNNSEMNGAYNAAICDEETHVTFLKKYKHSSGKRFVVMPAPVFIAKLVFGEMATLLTDGVAVSNQKMINSGFQPTYNTVEKAVIDLV